MEELIRYGEKLFDEIEIAVYRNRDVGISIELNEVSTSAVRQRTVTIVRGIKDKRLGLAIIDGESKDEVRKAIDEAYKMAKLNSRDEKWKSLPKPGKYKKPPNFDKALKDVSSDYFVELAKRGIELTLEKDKNIIVANGGGGAGWIESLILNSHGVEISQEGGGAYFYLGFIGRRESLVTPMIFDVDARRDLNLDIENIVENLTQKVKWAYNVEKSKTEEARVIVEPYALAGLLHFALFPAFSGEKLAKQTTPLADKVGEQVFNELLTIYDDPFHELSLKPVIADDEGVPTRKNALIENGTFKGFLWDNYWANVYETESTGNGIRNPSTGGISIGTHSVVIKNGKESLWELIADIEHGYLVNGFQGAHSSNPDNGNFAVVANPAYLIEDGEIKGSTVFMMSGNVYELLKDVYAVSKEQKVVPFYGTTISPSMAFANVRIAGKY